MELSIRDWMVIIGVLLFLIVVLDGYRRMQRERKQRVKMSRKAEKVQYGSAEPEQRLSELPNGGNKRLIADNLAREEDKYDPLFHNPFDWDEERAAESVLSAVETPLSAPEVMSAQDEDEATNYQSDPEHILIIHVLAKANESFDGGNLKAILDACDCRLDKRGIFNRFELQEGKGAIQFSIVNAFEPGYFDSNELASFATSGISFFMRLPGPTDALQAYNNMVEVARCVAKNLHGHLQDEQRSSMTEQTLEHERQRIRDYLQQQLTEHSEY